MTAAALPTPPEPTVPSGGGSTPVYELPPPVRRGDASARYRVALSGALEQLIEHTESTLSTPQ